MLCPIAMSFLALISSGDELSTDKLQTILRGAAEAGGGVAALSQVKGATCVCDGRFLIDDSATYFRLEYAIAFPDRVREKITIKQDKRAYSVTVVISGENGWRRRAGWDPRPSREKLRSKAVDEYRALIHDVQRMFLPTALASDTGALSLVGQVTVAGKAAMGLQVSQPGGSPVRLFYSTESGELLKCDRFAHCGLFPDKRETEIYFQDYRPDGSIRIPHRLEFRRQGTPFLELAIRDVKVFTAQLDGALFVAP